MSNITKLATAVALATLAFAATDLSASAQSTLSSDGVDANAPRRGTVHRKLPRGQESGLRHAAYADRRPLTVRRTVAGTMAPVVVVQAPVVNTGPGTIVTAPLGFASTVVSLPFRAMSGIFPATGDIGTNPLVLVGAPLHAVGDIVQFPFRIIGAPFGGTTIASY